MFIRNCWYVAAWAHELDGQALLARTLLSEPVLLYRRENGEPVALADRCCHRHAPLSLGRREGDAVRCMYHGLMFEPGGRCVDVPGLETPPASLCVRSYPVVQRGTWVWVWMGEPSLADEALVPDDVAMMATDWPYRPGYLRTEADYRLVNDNLLDFSHLSYVHEATLGGSTAIAQTRPVVEALPRGLRVTREIRDTVPAPYHLKFGRFDGPVNRLMRYDYLVPGVLLMHSYVKPNHTPDDDMTGALRMRSCQALTPETAHTTHYFFMQGHEFRRDDPTVTEAVYQSLLQAFAEDKRMIEAQQQLLLRDQASGIAVPPMKPMAADLALVQFRRLLDRLLAEEQAQQETRA